MNEMFMTIHYKVLKLMKENMITIANQTFCPLSQNDIAEELDISRPFTNKIFTDLKNQEYIAMLNKGKWILLDKANLLLERTYDL